LLPARCRIGWRRSFVEYRPIVTNAQGEERKWSNRNRNVEPGGRKHEPINLDGPREDCEEKIPMAANNTYRAKAWECLSLAECMNDPQERAEMVRFASMWMRLAEPIDEARGVYEFPR
jgi:hypothetical protein